MGILDDLVDVVETPLKIGTGVISGAQNAASLVGNVLDGDFPGAIDDGVALMGDASDIAEGLGGLGFSVGPLPTAFGSSKALKPADSDVLAAAQLVIDGIKKTTGSGVPVNGDEFRGSSDRLVEVGKTLTKAEPHADRWDGTASQVYNATNASHRRLAVGVQQADANIAKVLDTEADQVARTRTTLDDVSNGLSDFDLTTCWMNATGPGRALKFALDVAAAGVALQTVGVSITSLVADSVENADKIRDEISKYEEASKDYSGDPGDCSVFPAILEEDLQGGDPRATPLPDAASGPTAPSRSDRATPYTIPSPEEPVEYGPPTTPYGMPAPAVPSASPAPQSAAPVSAPGPRASTAPSTRPAPAMAAPGARTAAGGGRAPVETPVPDQTGRAIPAQP